MFELEESPFGNCYVALLEEWEASGRPDPVTGDEIALDAMPMRPRVGPDHTVHFYYGVAPSGVPLKLIVSQKEDSRGSNR